MKKITIGLFLLSIPELLFAYNGIISNNITLILSWAVVIVVSVGLLVFILMNSNIFEEKRKTKKETQNKKVAKIESEIPTLSKKIENLEKTIANLDEAIYNKITDDIIKKISTEDEAIKSIVENIKRQNDEIKAKNKDLDSRLNDLKIEDKIQKELKNIPSHKINEHYIKDEIEKKKKRLKRQLRSTYILVTLNLFVGMSISVIVLNYLGNIIDISKEHTGNIILFIISRGAFAILGELLAFFFLRLYSKNQIEIKYINNEISNIESQIIGLYIMKNKPDYDNDMENKVIEELIKTERNFVIKKDEKTVISNQQEQTESQIKTYLTHIIKLLETFKK